MNMKIIITVNVFNSVTCPSLSCKSRVRWQSH